MSSIIKISKLYNHLFEMGFVKESQILVKLSSEKAEEFLKNKYPIGYSIYKRTEGIPPQAFIGMFNSFTESEMAKVNESMSFEQLKAIKKNSKSKNKASKIKKIKDIILKSDARYEDIDSITDKFMSKGFSIEDVEYLVKDTTNHSLEEKADMLYYFIQKNSDKPYNDFETLDEAVAYVSPKLGVDAEEFYKSIEDSAFENSDIMYNSEKFTVIHSKSTEAAQYWEQSAVTWEKDGRHTSGLCTADPATSLFETYSRENYVVQIISKPFPSKKINPIVSFSDNLKKNNLISMCLDKKTGEIVEGFGATVNRFNENLTSLQIYMLLGEEFSNIMKSIYSNLVSDSGMDKELANKNLDKYLKYSINEISISSALLNKSVMETDIAKSRIIQGIANLDVLKTNYSEDYKSKDGFSIVFRVLKIPYSDLKELLYDDNIRNTVEFLSERIKFYAGEEGFYRPPQIDVEKRLPSDFSIQNMGQREDTVFRVVMAEKYNEYCEDFIDVLIRNFRSKIKEEETFGKFVEFLAESSYNKRLNDSVWEDTLSRNKEKINSLAKAIATRMGADDVNNIDVFSAGGLFGFITIRNKSGDIIVNYDKVVGKETPMINYITIEMSRMKSDEIAKYISEISDSAVRNTQFYLHLEDLSRRNCEILNELGLDHRSSEYHVTKLIRELIFVLASLKMCDSEYVPLKGYELIRILKAIEKACLISGSLKRDFEALPPTGPLNDQPSRQIVRDRLSESDQFREIADRCANSFYELKDFVKNLIYKHYIAVEEDDDTLMSWLGHSTGRSSIIPAASELEEIRVSALRHKREKSEYEFVSKVDEIPDLCRLFKQHETVRDDDGTDIVRIYTSYMIPSLSDCEYFIKHRLHECEDSGKETARRLDNTDVYRSDSFENRDLSLYIMDLEEQCGEGYSDIETVSNEEDFGAFYPSKHMDDVIEYSEDYGHYDNDNLSESDDDNWGSSEGERDILLDINRRARYSFLYKIVKGF